MTDTADFFASLARDTAAGAAVGATLGPVGAAAGAGVAAVADIADAVGLTRWLFGPGAEATKTAMLDAVVQATGTTSLPAQGAVLARDPEAVARLRVSLAGIAAAREAAADASRLATLQAGLADVAGARAQTMHLADTGSVLAWGAPLVSVVCLLGWGCISLLALWLVVVHSPLPDGTIAVLSLILGTAGSMGVAVVSYWIGSSAGSARKSDAIERLKTTPPSGG